MVHHSFLFEQLKLQKDTYLLLHVVDMLHADMRKTMPKLCLFDDMTDASHSRLIDYVEHKVERTVEWSRRIFMLCYWDFFLLPIRSQIEIDWFSACIEVVESR